MADTQILLSSASIGSHTATAVWDSQIQIKKEKDQVFYRKSVRNRITFTGATYGYLTALDTDACEEVTIQIQRRCAGAWATYLTGHFNAGDWIDNFDDCAITVRVETADDYDCFLGSWETPINVYAETVVEVKPYPTTESYIVDQAYSQCEDCGFVVDMPDPSNWCAEYEGTYCTPTINPAVCSPITTDAYTVWHRIEGTGSCSGGTPVAPTPDSYWTLLTNNCPTDSTWWRCPGEEVNDVNARMNQGRLFSDVLEAILAPCGLTVVSDFFNINPDASAPANDAYTFASNYLQTLTIHQKSDVKRPYNSDPATSKQWDIAPKKMLSDLRILFNVYWTISGSTIRIEHISYFAQTGGLDASADAQKNLLEREVEDNIGKEYFFYMDNEGSDYFLGYPIEYDCGIDERENRCQYISTDVSYIQNTNSEGFADEGFVLCSTEFIASVYYLVRDNRPLSFTELHEDLHRHFRYWKTGNLNNASETFTTYRPTRKQPAFDHVFCCDDTFDENKPVTTAIGAGYLETAIYDIESDSLNIEVKH